jgi:hypothetical protein
MKLHILICMFTVAALLGGCGGSEPKQPPIGEIVKVQFRRDALGSAHDLPVSPTTDSQNGARVSLSGTLMLVNEDWIVLEYQKRAHWIPRHAVLLIRVDNEVKTPTK